MENESSETIITDLKRNLFLLKFSLSRNPALVNRRNKHLWIPHDKVLEMETEIKCIKAKLILLGVNKDEYD
jgi:hypothetical protein